MLTPVATTSAAAENVAPSGIGPGNALKLRFTISEIGGLISENVKMRLQYSLFDDFSSDVHFVGEIGSTTADWSYYDGSGSDNELVSSTTLSDSTDFGTYNESGMSASTYLHSTSTAVEYEFTIKNYKATTTSVYYFRAYTSYYKAPYLYEYEVPKNISESYPSLLVSSSSLSYVIAGLPASTVTEGITTDFLTTATSVPFGDLDYNIETEGAQRFTITTNAEYGYQLFIQQRQAMISSGGAIIDPISTYNNNPGSWSINPNPSGFGYHAGDDTLSGLSPSRFSPDHSYACFESTIEEIGYSSIPVKDEITDFVYKLEVTSQQEAGDYETEIVYILVPTY